MIPVNAAFIFRKQDFIFMGNQTLIWEYFDRKRSQNCLGWKTPLRSSKLCLIHTWSPRPTSRNSLELQGIPNLPEPFPRSGRPFQEEILVSNLNTPCSISQNLSPDRFSSLCLLHPPCPLFPLIQGSSWDNFYKTRMLSPPFLFPIFASTRGAGCKSRARPNT